MNSSTQQEAERYLISQFAPPAVIVDDQFSITGFFGDVGPFIQPVPGAASLKLFKMARPELTAALTRLLETAMSTLSPGQHPSIPLEREGKPIDLVLRVVPLTTNDPGEFLVIFDARDVSSARHDASDDLLVLPAGGDHASRIAELETQARFLRDELRRARTEQVSAGEELQAANEEIQSTNEELQSTNEELESAKEELQSTNEELTSINTELSAKIADLAAGNDDLLSMLSSLDMPLVLLSRDLHVVRFTSPARGLLNLIDGDVGRPFAHVRPNIELPALESLCVQVLETRVPQSVECRTAMGDWHSLSVRPHLSGAGSVAGVLLVFVNVSVLRLAPDRSHGLSHMRRDVDDIVNLLDQEGRFITWSERAEHYYGYNEIEALRMGILDIVPETERAGIQALLQSARDRHAGVAVRQRRICKDRAIHEVVARLIAMYDQRGNLYAFTLTDSPLEKWHADIDIAAGLIDRLSQTDEAFVVITADGDVVCWSEAAERLYGYPAREIIGKSTDLYWVDLLPSWNVAVEGASSLTPGVTSYSVVRKRKTGENIHVNGDYLVLNREGRPFLLAMREKKA